MNEDQSKHELVKSIENEIDLMKSNLIQQILQSPDGGLGIASEFTTSKKAAKILGISLPTLYKYSKQGIIKQYRLGNKVYYRIDELHRAISIIL
jgi:excisionase family DNA binding protein